MVRAGAEGAEEFEVTGRLLTDVAGTLPRRVLSTPGMIAMMERTAAALVRPELGPGRTTVGFEVCIKHVAAAPEGARCTARARLEQVRDGRKLHFRVEVTDGEGNTVGLGEHQRRVIEVPE